MMKRSLVTKILGKPVRFSSGKLPSSRISLATTFPATKRILPHAALSQHIRLLSTEMRAQTAAVAAANAAIAAEKQAGAAAGGAKKKAESNVFLDNLGKIFLMGIATIIATLVRSSYNTSNRNEVRDRIEDMSAMDPQELQDFREANSELTIDAVRKIVSIYYEEYAPTDTISTTTSSLGEYSAIKDQGSNSSSSHPFTTYKEFLRNVRSIMATRFPEYGESFTLQMGHFLDRMVVDVLEQRAETATASDKSLDEKDGELPVALFWTALVAAMDGPVSDRIRILHEIMRMEQGQKVVEEGEVRIASEENSARAVVPLSSVRDAVGYLQETCQLPPDTQIVPTERKYPTQQWRRATPYDLVPEDIQSEMNNKNTDGVDLVEFAAILRTKSVCAWGECYMRLKPNEREFEKAPGAVASK